MKKIFGILAFLGAALAVLWVIAGMPNPSSHLTGGDPERNPASRIPELSPLAPAENPFQKVNPFRGGYQNPFEQ